MVEFQLGVNAVGGGAPYLAHHIMRASGLVWMAQDFQVCSPFTADDTAKMVNLSVYGRSLFSTWIGLLLVVFSAITKVLLLLMLRPTCFAKMLSHRVFS